MAITVRPMQPEDARLFLEVHHASVRGLAAKDYPPVVIEQWVRLPITDLSVERFLDNPAKEIRLVAELNGVMSG